MPRVYVGGVGGCGKTVACKAFATKHPDVSCLTGSEIMMKAAGVGTREELMNLPDEVKEPLRARAFEAYYQSNGQLVIDGHFYLTGTDIRYLDAFILLEVDLPKLTLFRIGDSSRARSLKREEMQSEITLMEERVRHLERTYSIRVIRINNGGSIDDLVTKIEQVYYAP